MVGNLILDVIYMALGVLAKKIPGRGRNYPRSGHLGTKAYHGVYRCLFPFRAFIDHHRMEI